MKTNLGVQVSGGGGAGGVRACVRAGGIRARDSPVRQNHTLYLYIYIYIYTYVHMYVNILILYIY